MTTVALALALAVWGRASGVAALSPGVASPAPAPAAPPGFAKDVAPILDKWCVSCHGGKEAEADLRLDSYDAILKGGEDGPVIVPGDPEGSQLLAQIERRVRPPMPPKRRLPKDPVATIRAWIISGAGP
jgi:hypothetical protein